MCAVDRYRHRWHAEVVRTILQVGTLDAWFRSAEPVQDSSRWRVLPHAASGLLLIALISFPHLMHLTPGWNTFHQLNIGPSFV